MIPDASAGSNQLEANEIVTAQVTCPSGLAALAGQEAPINRARARTARMLWQKRRGARVLCDLHRDADNLAGTSPTCATAMAFPFDSARRISTTHAAPCFSPRPHAQRTNNLVPKGKRPRRRFDSIYCIANALPREENARASPPGRS